MEDLRNEKTGTLVRSNISPENNSSNNALNALNHNNDYIYTDLSDRKQR